ncbi:MAG: cellular and retroviral pepsin-like aspartate proteases [Treponematales bacterium]
MSVVSLHNFHVKANPPLPEGTGLTISVSPQPLALMGLCIPVEISTASIFRQCPEPAPLASIAVMGHFDTGATKTSIDITLAQHLSLKPLGISTIYTAAGAQAMPDFAIDLSFPNTKLSSAVNLKIGSCKLNWMMPDNPQSLNNPKNFGILLGRDIMARWNIVWNGPTSTVFISD